MPLSFYCPCVIYEYGTFLCERVDHLAFLEEEKQRFVEWGPKRKTREMEKWMVGSRSRRGFWGISIKGDPKVDRGKETKTTSKWRAGKKEPRE